MSDQMIPNEVASVGVPGNYIDDQAEFEADLAYLQGLSTAILEHATPQALMRIAAFDGDNA
jgi:hypothetical protein